MMSALAVRRQLLADNEVHPAMGLSEAVRIEQERATPFPASLCRRKDSLGN